MDPCYYYPKPCGMHKQTRLCDGRGAEGGREITGPLGQEGNCPADEPGLLTLTITSPYDKKQSSSFL